MLDHAALTPEALAYFRGLPLGDQIAMQHSNLSFRTVDELKAYRSSMLSDLDAVLYKRLPDPAVPSNAALDPLDAE